MTQMLTRAKEESAKAGLQLNIINTKEAMASGQVDNWLLDGHEMEMVTDSTQPGANINWNGLLN